MNLSNVTIAITTFLRPGYLKQALVGCLNNFPECPRIVAVDDGGYTPVADWAHSLLPVVLPFDSGLTAKRNAAVKFTKTPYVLMASDDYDFRAPYVRAGVERLIATLDAHPEISVAVGTFNRKWYQGFLEYEPGKYIKEIPLQRDTMPTYTKPYPAFKVDIGINYFVARTAALRECPWDESIRPIGGEHGDWFLSLKKQQKVVVWVPDCYIESMLLNEKWQHSGYRDYRRRAHLGHEIFLKKWSVANYIEGLQ